MTKSIADLDFDDLSALSFSAFEEARKEALDAGLQVSPSPGVIIRSVDTRSNDATFTKFGLKDPSN